MPTAQTTWRKSSYSGGQEGEACVEVGWRKSSYSGNQEGEDCVEVAYPASTAVAVRDSKNTIGPVLAFSASTWRAFTRTR